MKMYCPVRPRNSSRSVSTCSGVKAIQLTTAVEVAVPERRPRRIAGPGCRRAAPSRPREPGRRRVAPVEQVQVEPLLDGQRGAGGADDAGPADEQDFDTHAVLIRRAAGLFLPCSRPGGESVVGRTRHFQCRVSAIAPRSRTGSCRRLLLQQRTVLGAELGDLRRDHALAVRLVGCRL